MKKWLTALLCVLLTLAMVLSLAACGEDTKKKRSSDDDDEDDEKTSENGDVDEDEDEDKEPEQEEPKTDAELIVGRWEAYADLGKQSTAMYQAMGMDLTLPSAKVKMTLTFGEDGSYKAVYDEEEMDSAALRCGEALIDELADLYGMSADEFLEESGYRSRDEFLEEFMSSFTSTLSMVGDGTGRYEIKDGDLYRYVADIEAVAEPFTVTKTQLKLMFPEDALKDVPEESRELTRKILESQYPITLTRVN